jgi:ribosomal protein S14
MSALSLISKDKRLRVQASKHFVIRLKLKFYLNSTIFAQINRYFLTLKFFQKLKWVLFSKIQTKNRCLITGRTQSVFSYFRLTRMILKNYSSYGFITGISKASW